MIVVLWGLHCYQLQANISIKNKQLLDKLIIEKLKISSHLTHKKATAAAIACLWCLVLLALSTDFSDKH